jgi:hypothetical protein
MSWKWIGILAVLAVVLFIVATSSGGSSSNDSSGWSAVESKIMNETTTADGARPTKSQAECVVTGLKPLASADEVLEDADASSQQEEEIHQIVTDCIEGSSSSEESSELSTEQPESVAAGPARQADLGSSACQAEEQEKIETAQQEEMEIYEESQESAEAPLP